MRPALPLLALLLAAPGLSAQAVAGRLREEGTGTPIPGAVVVLLDGGGARRSATLTDAQGRFLLHAPAAGPHRLRAERIGFRSTLSPVFHLTPGDTAAHDLAAPAEAIRLDAIEVASERRCVLRPAEGMQAATLWEEARKALDAAALTQDQALVRFRVRRYDRRLDPEFLRVRGEQSISRSHLGSEPFASLPADDLARNGYVRRDGDGWIYYAPDAEVLLSDSFLDTHCFRVRRGDGATGGLVGLAFEPLRSHRLPDVQGVLWLDPGTSELRFVEFGYTRTETHRAGAQGGRVDYERLPSGAWIVRRWWIRMPILGRDAARDRTVLVGVKETGGEVDDLVGGGIAPELAALSGTVFDSTTATPLAGATVYLSGTSHSALTDASGSFRLDAAPEGEFTLGVLHPRLDSLGVLAPTRQVTLARGQPVRVELALPPLPTLLARACAASAPAGTGLVIGSVVDEPTGLTLPGARVTLSWTEAGRAREVARISDRDGGFHFCGAPATTPIRARARLLGRTGRERELRVTGGEAARVDLPIRLSTRPVTTQPDRRTTFGPGAPAVLRGRVLTAAGEPVAGAVIRLEGTSAQGTSDAAGDFELQGLAADAYVLSVEHAALGGTREAVQLTGGVNEAEVRIGERQPR